MRHFAINFFFFKKLQKTTTTLCFSLFSTHFIHISHYFPMGEIQFPHGGNSIPHIWRNSLNFPNGDIKPLKISLDRRSQFFPGLADPNILVPKFCWHSQFSIHLWNIHATCPKCSWKLQLNAKKHPILARVLGKKFD